MLLSEEASLAFLSILCKADMYFSRSPYLLFILHVNEAPLKALKQATPSL